MKPNVTCGICTDRNCQTFSKKALHTGVLESRNLSPSRKARVSTKIEGPPGEGPGHHMLVGWLRRRAEAVERDGSAETRGERRRTASGAGPEKSDGTRAAIAKTPRTHTSRGLRPCIGHQPDSLGEPRRGGLDWLGSAEHSPLRQKPDGAWVRIGGAGRARTDDDQIMSPGL